jgi:hypothetical protein
MRYTCSRCPMLRAVSCGELRAAPEATQKAIDSKLAEDGMGVVYRAFDTDGDCAVAIKVLRPDAILTRRQEHLHGVNAHPADKG